jgi:type IX secretion system PorP/SprF family membrane protein
MGIRGFCALFLLMTATAVSQTLELPQDFRQHNLLDYNSNLLNPVLSLQQPAQQQLALWTRWQWQSIDADPTTLYLSYLRNEGDVAFGAGFFQHNTGLFQQNGGVLNFAYRLSLGNDFGLAIGMNLFGYQRQLADDRFIPGEPVLPIEDEVNDFIIQVAPGLEVQVERFALGVSFENLVDYNFAESEAVTASDEKTITVMGRYAFLVSENAAGRQTFLQPQLYYRRIPIYDNQVGLSAVWSAPSYWVQTGYNSFYGFALGAGARLFDRVSIGGLMEFGSNDNDVGGNTSYEVVLAFSFGRKRPVPPKEEPEEELIVQQAEPDPEQAEIATEIDAQQRAIEEAALRQDSLITAAREQELALQRRRDSIQQMQEAALALGKRQDSIREAEEAALALREKVVPEKGEKYQEVSQAEGLEPGFYLIANVFSTKRYYSLFMQRLQDRGLEPKSFYRSTNKFNYVYLRRYNSIEEARRARDSKFEGRYQGELWIFRVR